MTSTATKKKQTNVLSSTADDLETLMPPKKLSLELCRDDGAAKTPADAVRFCQIVLDQNERAQSAARARRSSRGAVRLYEEFAHRASRDPGPDQRASRRRRVSDISSSPHDGQRGIRTGLAPARLPASSNDVPLWSCNPDPHGALQWHNPGHVGRTDVTSNRDRRILLVTRYFPPLDSVATMRMHAWAKYLDARGWDVSVLTTSKRGQVVTPLNRDLSRFSVTEVPYFDPLALAGVDKSAFVSQQTRPDRGIGRKLQVRLSQFYRQRMNERMPGRTDPWIIPAIGELRRQSRAGKTYQYVISSYGPPSALVVGHAAAKLFGATWVADYRDLWLENHAYAGLWPFTLVERLIETRTVQRRADLITTVSRRPGHRAEEEIPRNSHSGDRERIRPADNGPSPCRILRRPTAKLSRRIHGHHPAEEARSLSVLPSIETPLHTRTIGPRENRSAVLWQFNGGSTAAHRNIRPFPHRAILRRRRSPRRRFNSKIGRPASLSRSARPTCRWHIDREVI